MLNVFTTSKKESIPIIFITKNNYKEWLSKKSSLTKTWLEQQKFSAKPDTFCVIPNAKGKIEKVVVGHSHQDDVFFAGTLSTLLPEGIYHLENYHVRAALAWGMGAYQFKHYKKPTKTVSQLLLPPGDHKELFAKLKAIYLIRDLINTPTEDMDPSALSKASEKIASEFGAKFHEIVGDDLLTHHFPAIHTVGRASTRPPRLIDITWGNEKHPKVTLVGKGVCFDSGGLDIKPANAMALMKKDMAGGAHVLGLAYLIMHSKLPVRLRVLIPAVENVISGNAYRPGDIIKSRKGLTIEIGNTDAEGRVILADALTEASSENPELIIDMASLTGAARIALGADLPAFFTNDDKLANELMLIGKEIQDPIWRLPLYAPYRKQLDSPYADINNATNSPLAGAITAALFLKEFVQEKISWLHFDIMAWNLSSTPSHPEGAEAVAIRTIYKYLKKRFGKS